MLFPLARVLSLALALAGGVTTAALADDPKEVASNGQWRGFTFVENGKTGCYLLSQPAKNEGNYTQRGPIYVFVTHRPAMKIFDEVTIDAGYTFQKDSTVKVTVGTRDFTLVTDAGRAWVESAATDKQLVEAMKRGNDMVVRGVSSRGTRTVDSYSLSGFSATYQAVAKVCK
jgi:hypothetical protein